MSGSRVSRAMAKSNMAKDTKHEALKEAMTGKRRHRAIKSVKNLESMRKNKTYTMMAKVDAPNSKGYDVKR